MTANRRGICAHARLLALALSLPLCFGSSRAGEHDTPDVTAPASADCQLEPGPYRTVTRVIDGETLALDDGSEAVLIGAMAPRARDAGATAGQWPPEENAIGALKTLVLGKTVQLTYGKSSRDRYGRHLAHIFVPDGADPIWVQGAQLAAGHARAYALPGDGSCLAALKAHEGLARATNLGIWSVALYRAIRADRIGQLKLARSTYQIVAGDVRSVTRLKSAAYVNFGADWHTDFSLRIPKTVLDSSPWSANLEALQGRSVEVRGWIERRNGPSITLAHPDELSIQGGEPASQPPQAPSEQMPPAALSKGQPL